MSGNKLRFVLVISVILNLSFLAAAGYQYYRQSAYWISPFGMKIQKGKFLFEELSLKPEQARAMKDKAIPFREEIDRQRRGISGKRKELLTLLRADSPDMKAIDSIISEISDMQEKMQRKVTVHMLEEKALLEKEQQQKFLDLIENAMTKGRQIGCPPTEQN